MQRDRRVLPNLFFIPPPPPPPPPIVTPEQIDIPQPWATPRCLLPLGLLLDLLTPNTSRLSPGNWVQPLAVVVSMRCRLTVTVPPAVFLFDPDDQLVIMPTASSVARLSQPLPAPT